VRPVEENEYEPEGTSYFLHLAFLQFTVQKLRMKTSLSLEPGIERNSVSAYNDYCRRY
jgi:hypothetical protein